MVADDPNTSEKAADKFLNSFQSAPALVAGVVFLVSVILLAWPARRPKDVSSSPAYYPVDRSHAAAAPASVKAGAVSFPR